MARIPQSEIERIKQEVAIERLVQASGIELKKTGKDLFGRCPFHAPDNTPSLSVTPASNLWNCLGACKEGGDVFKWVMKMQGVSFRHAYEILNTDPSLAAAARPVIKGTIRRLPAPVAPDAEGQGLIVQTVDYYRDRLKQLPAGLAYLEKRGIRSLDLIECFKLGFADRTLGLRLPDKQRAAGAAMRARLTRIGILLPSGHERFNGSIVIPVFDEQGNVTEVYGRKVNDNLRAGTAKHLYLPAECRGPTRGVWNVPALARYKEIILCEALIDALTFVAAGFPNVTSAYGTSGFTEEHLAAFKRYQTERVLIAYDRDAAGDAAALALAARLMHEGIECYRIEFPKGMDANEYALKVQPAAKSLGLAIRKAAWLGKGKSPGAPRSAAAEPEIQVRHVVHPIEPLAPSAPASAVSSLGAEAASAPGVPTEASVREAAPALEADAVNRLTAPAEPLAAARTTPLPASPLPAAPADKIAVEVREAEIVMRLGVGAEERCYRVRGLEKNLAYDVIKVNVLVERGEAFHVDTLDLRAAKPKAAYIAQAAAELKVDPEILNADLRHVFRKLEALQEANIKGALAPKGAPAVAIDPAERERALDLLRAPDLMQRIPADLTACGLVGEEKNKLVAYIAVSSRKLEQPLAVLVQSSSAAGKTSLMDAVLAMVPEEERVKYSALTGQSLFYLGERDLQHKVLAIVEEEGASRAAYALKLLQSEGELVIASTGKDPQTGELQAQDYTVKGPVMLFTTTTAADIEPELQNRCLVLAIDEGREQTRAIHALQRHKRTLEGLIARARKAELLAIHQNAQRLLRPLGVLNPYAPRLTFPDAATRLRRDHEKYLTLIDTIALLHQFQRPVKSTLEAGKTIEYIEATLNDIALANELAHEVLGRSLDELPPQTRRVLAALDRYVSERAQALGVERNQVRFTRRELREASAIGDTQLRLHLDRLVALEYVLVHRGARGASFVYELVYDGTGGDGKPFVPGLIDLEALKAAATTANLAGLRAPPTGQEVNLAGSTRGESGPNAGDRGMAEIVLTAERASTSSPSTEKLPKTPSKGGNSQSTSYPQGPVAAVGKSDATHSSLAARSPRP